MALPDIALFLLKSLNCSCHGTCDSFPVSKISRNSPHTKRNYEAALSGKTCRLMEVHFTRTKNCIQHSPTSRKYRLKHLLGFHVAFLFLKRTKLSLTNRKPKTTRLHSLTLFAYRGATHACDCSTHTLRNHQSQA